MSLRMLSLCVALGLSLSACDRTPPPKPTAKPAAVKPATPPASQAGAGTEATNEVNALMALLTKKHPDMGLSPTQINKVALGQDILFEVVTPSGTFYTNKNVDYMLFGNLFVGEGNQVVNFTQRSGLPAAPAGPQLSEETVTGAAIFQSLPFSKGLNYIYGTGSHHIAVFEDPDCTHCQAFHQDLEEHGNELNVKVTVFPFVLSSQHPNGLAHAKALMCAPDPAAAWKAWMLAANGQTNLDALWAKWAPKNAPTSNCEATAFVDELQEAGQALGFTATPVIMYENGGTSEGRPPLDAFAKALDHATGVALAASAQEKAKAAQIPPQVAPSQAPSVQPQLPPAQ